jgi:hypothetical protein
MVINDVDFGNGNKKDFASISELEECISLTMASLLLSR